MRDWKTTARARLPCLRGDFGAGHGGVRPLFQHSAVRLVQRGVKRVHAEVGREGEDRIALSKTGEQDADKLVGAVARRDAARRPP